MSQLRAGTLAVIVGLAGCGGGGGSVSPDEFGDAIAQALCERYARCGVVASVAECLDLVQVGGEFTELIHAVEMGTIEYDGGKVAECLDAFAAASCDDTSESVRHEPDGRAE